MSGRTAYAPTVFWIGVGTLALGVILKLVRSRSMDHANIPGPRANVPTVDVHASVEAMTKKCPQCPGKIKLEALVCRYCGQRFAAENVKTQVETAKLERERASVLASVGAWTTCSHCKQLIRPAEPHTEPVVEV